MQKDTTKIKYFVYCRKSSEDNKERQMQSIESQEGELMRVVEEQKLQVVKVFREEKSAHTRGRSLFGKMMEGLENGEANAILTYHGNRLARNAFDGGWIITAMDEGKVREIKTPHRTYYNSSDDKFFLQLEFGIAKKDSDDKSVVVKRGLNRKSEKGWMPGVAPMGYLNTPELAGGSRYIKIDPERFDLLKKVWDMMASGKYSVSRIREIMNNEWGFTNRKFKRQGGGPISLGKLYKMFNTPFYYGYFEYPRDSGQWREGAHEKMITEDVFNRVQYILGNKMRTRPKKTPFAFGTGLMRCGECNAQITAEEKWKHQKNGNVHHYIYYRCTKRINPECSQKAIKEEELKKQIAETIEQISIPSKLNEFALKWFRKTNEKEAESRDVVINAQQRAFTLCVNKINGLIDMRAAGEITPEEFAKRKSELLEEKDRLENLISKSSLGINKWLEIAENVFAFASQAKERFETGNLETKKQILSALGSDLILKDKKLGINLDKALIPMKVVSKEVKKVKGRLEPLNNVANKRKTDDFSSVSPTLLRGPDSNRRPLGYEPNELPLLYPAI